MSDFNPVTLFFILSESLGPWLWVLLGLAVVLLAGVVAGFVKLRRAGRPVSGSLLAGIVTGLIAAAGLTFVVPMWTLADPSALSAPIDYAIAFILALLPGAAVASLVFMFSARWCASRGVVAA